MQVVVQCVGVLVHRKLIIVQNTNVVQHTCCQDSGNTCLDILLIKMLESRESAFHSSRSIARSIGLRMLTCIWLNLF